MPNAKFFGVSPGNAAQYRNSLMSTVTIPATAAGTAYEQVLGVWDSPYPPVLNFVKVIPQAAVALNATNFVQIQIVNRKGDGSGTSVLAQFSTVATAMSAYIASTLTPDFTQAGVNQGDVLTLNVVKQGTGVATPPMLLELDWKY